MFITTFPNFITSYDLLFFPLVNTPLPHLTGNTKVKMSVFSVAKCSTPSLKQIVYPESQSEMELACLFSWLVSQATKPFLI